MGHWIRGSGKWRAPNPGYDSEYTGKPATASFKSYGINWRWNPKLKYMFGEITGVMADGAETRFWTMFAFYNPVTKQVLFQQIGRNGAFISTESPARSEPLEFGETERLDATEYHPDGQIIHSRHENVFHEDGTHTSHVFQRNEAGKWVLKNQWTWKLTSIANGAAHE